jgi:surface polysaccharide O-acyltransferase-like enzyme
MTNGLSGPRKQFLDVLRVLATCAVVLMHVLTGATDVTDASIMPEYRSLLLSVMDLVTWCVPIFLLISGYLFLINSYTTGLQPAVLSYMMNSTLTKKFGGHVEAEEIGLPVTESGLVLPCGASGRWQRD